MYIYKCIYIMNIDGTGLYQRQNISKSQELCGLCFENHRFSLAEVPTAMADMEKPPLIYGEKDGFNLGEPADPRNMCEKKGCFFSTAWWFRLVKKHLKLKFPLICSAGGSNLDGVGLCWALCCLQNCSRATLPAAEALEGTGRRGLPGPKIFHVHTPSGNLTYLLNMTMTYS